jgi:hypothetical protein
MQRPAYFCDRDQQPAALHIVTEVAPADGPSDSPPRSLELDLCVPCAGLAIREFLTTLSHEAATEWVRTFLTRPATGAATR